MSTLKLDERQALFAALAGTLLGHPSVTRGTMTGYPCLRAGSAYFAYVERATGHGRPGTSE
jgi:hypothetical protein